VSACYLAKVVSYAAWRYTSNHANDPADWAVPVLFLGEPPHVHVDRERFSAKFWLKPVELARNLGFRAHELREIQSIINDHEVELLEAWDGHFGTGRR
jgi:hypothetical protein